MEDIFTPDEVIAGLDGAPPEAAIEAVETLAIDPEGVAPVDPEAGDLPDERERIDPPAEESRPRTRRVPHEKFHAEREEHKKTKAALEAANGQLQRIAEMRAAVQQAARDEAPDYGHDPESDPSGVRYLAAELDRLKARETNRNVAEADAGLAQAENQLLLSQLRDSEAEIKAAMPDYDAAAQHLAAARAQELSMWGHSPQEVQQMLAAEVLEITRNAIATGRSPAEFAYALARSRGYVPRGAPASGQNGRPVLSPAGQPSSATSAMLNAIARGQKQGRSLGAMPGGRRQRADDDGRSGGAQRWRVPAHLCDPRGPRADRRAGLSGTNENSRALRPGCFICINVNLFGQAEILRLAEVDRAALRAHAAFMAGVGIVDSARHRAAAADFEALLGAQGRIVDPVFGGPACGGSSFGRAVGKSIIGHLVSPSPFITKGADRRS